jgi:hypothetical protein
VNAELRLVDLPRSRPELRLRFEPRLGHGGERRLRRRDALAAFEPADDLAPLGSRVP